VTRSSLLFLSALAFTSCKQPPAPSLAPIDQSTQAPLVSNVTAGATVELWEGHPNARVLIATSPVAAGSTMTRVRLPSRLQPGRIVQARQTLSFRRSPFSNAVTVENNYVTNRYDIGGQAGIPMNRR
jgi:hypothetical protein